MPNFVGSIWNNMTRYAPSAYAAIKQGAGMFGAGFGGMRSGWAGSPSLMGNLASPSFLGRVGGSMSGFGGGIAEGAWSLGKFAHKYQAPIGFGIAAGAFAFGAMNYPSVDPKQYAEVRGHSPMQRFQASAQGDLVFGLNKTPDVNISPMAAAYM